MENFGMNNFRGSIHAMEEINSVLCEQTKIINKALSDVGFHTIGIDKISIELQSYTIHITKTKILIMYVLC